jgi:hypothetical protein
VSVLLRVCAVVLLRVCAVALVLRLSVNTQEEVDVQQWRGEKSEMVKAFKPKMWRYEEGI